MSSMTQKGRADRITTPFGFESTADEVIAGIDLSGRTAIVTGGSSGIGVETARALASAGATVTLAVRDIDAGRRAASRIVASTGNDKVRVDHIDLAEQASVTAFAARWQEPLHLLVNNAGVMALPALEFTVEGWEMHFATNHLGHFALAVRLHEALAAAGKARIVSVSSGMHRRSPVIFDDLNFSSRPYDPLLAYGQSKTANALFAVESTRRWAGDGITANALHPGSILDTNLSRHMDPAYIAGLRAHAAEVSSSQRPRFKTVEQGAATSVLVATAPVLTSVGGRYFEDCNEAAVVDTDVAASAGSGVAAFALDPAGASRLWDVSLDLVGLG